MPNQDAVQKRRKIFGLLAAVLVAFLLFNRCSTDAKVPDNADVERIFAFLLPEVDVVAEGGEPVRLKDANARLDSHECWRIKGSSLKDRVESRPIFNCVLRISGSDHKRFAAVIFAEHIPKSSVGEFYGRRLDLADVGRYNISVVRGEHRRNILRRRAPDALRREE